VLADQVRVDSFTEFVSANEANVRRALTASFGSENGREAAAEAFAYAWEHWDRIRMMANPSGYLYRVGRNQAARTSRVGVGGDLRRIVREMPWVEPELAGALAALSERQRTVFALLHAYEWTMSEVAELLDISKGSVQLHDRRAKRRLQRSLGVTR
jgi:RNA polymerase sigma factor (sigma-70 family)